MARAGRGNQSLWWQELQPWMNLYLPSIKPAKKVRLASKLRRVMQRGTDALERVVASGQAGWRMTGLRKLCSTRDPFPLANRNDRKLEKYLRSAQPAAYARGQQIRTARRL